MSRDNGTDPASTEEELTVDEDARAHAKKAAWHLAAIDELQRRAHAQVEESPGRKDLIANAFAGQIQAHQEAARIESNVAVALALTSLVDAPEGAGYLRVDVGRVAS